MKAFFDKFKELKGAEFIAIKSYINKHGEIADLVVNANISVQNAKERDLNTLKNLSANDIDIIAKETSLPVEVLKIALTEMIESAEKNVSTEMSKHTNQSKAQSDAYIHLTPSVRLHKESLNLFVSGFSHQKNILVKGEYPIVKKREKTLCKEAIGKYCELKMLKYRQYNVGQMDVVKIKGTELFMR